MFYPEGNLCLILCHLEFDFDEGSTSRQSIEDRLVEEYRDCSYARDTKAELERITQGHDYTTLHKARTVTYNSPFFHQLKWVLQRTFRNLMLNPQTSVAQVINIVQSVGGKSKLCEKNVQTASEQLHFYQHELVSLFGRAFELAPV